MPKPEAGPNRHHFRIWIKMALQSGLIDKLPSIYEPDGFQNALRTDQYARHLLAELRDPDASHRTLKEIIADARRFKSWVETRRKDARSRMLMDSRPEDRRIEMPPRQPRVTIAAERRALRAQRPDQTDADPKFHPMWDDWIDSLER